MGAVIILRLEGSSIGPRTESLVNWDGPVAMVPCLHQGNIYIKGGSIGPRMESLVNWDGPMAMVPCLHQGNIYTKRKLRVWTDQKCILLVGAIIPLTCVGRENSPARGWQYRAQYGKLHKL